MSNTERVTPKTIFGVVEKISGAKTARLRIDYTEKHPLYKKYLRRSKTLIFHDELEQCRIGDRVHVMETRPLSKLKRHRLVKVVESEGVES